MKTYANERNEVRVVPELRRNVIRAMAERAKVEAFWIKIALAVGIFSMFSGLFAGATGDVYEAFGVPGLLLCAVATGLGAALVGAWFAPTPTEILRDHEQRMRMMRVTAS